MHPVGPSISSPTPNPAVRRRGRYTSALAGLSVGLVLLGVAGCAKPKTDVASTTSSSVPAGGVAAGQLPSTIAPTIPVVTAPRKPECLASDLWGFAILKATDPAQAAGLTKDALAANLQTTADAIKAVVAVNAPDIDIRTGIAKKKLDGVALTDADTQAEKDASSRLDTWYKATCPA